jgi:hypothetical protein
LGMVIKCGGSSALKVVSRQVDLKKLGIVSQVIINGTIRKLSSKYSHHLRSGGC